MEGIPMKFCSHCGKEIHQRAVVCSKCGARQVVEKKRMPTVAIVAIIAALGFVGIVFLGIIAAIAIPQFATYRDRSFNTSAIASLKNAATAVENYYNETRVYPDSLDQTSFKGLQGVTVNYQRLDETGYEIYASHDKGRKVFGLSSSDRNKIMVKDRRAPDSEFVPLP